MKETKICIIATLVFCIVLILCSFVMSAAAESEPEFFPKLTIVVETIRIDTRLWVVECQDKDGNVWGFYDDEGTWKEGDIANLLMFSRNDNEVVNVEWEGYTEDITNWLQTIGWR